MLTFHFWFFLREKFEFCLFCIFAFVLGWGCLFTKGSLIMPDTVTACGNIEEVGSTGVGALTVAFFIFAVCTVVFLAKSNTSGEQRK